MLTGSVMGLMLLIGGVQADIYRSQDEFGNTIFSDRPAIDAEKIELHTSPYRYRVSVRQVIDGDTLVLDDGEKVRLIGINTPEVESRFTRSQAGGDEAREWLRNKLDEPIVWLEYGAEQFDKYGRRLAHVFLGSGEYLNASLLREGLAMLTLTPPNLRYSEQLIAAQQEAEEANRGIWQRPEYQLKSQAQFQPGSSYPGWQRWLLTPRQLSESRQYMNLIVSEHWILRIPKSHLALFPPLTQYLDRPVEVRGWLRRQGHQHSMLIQHPSAMLRK